MLGYFSLSRHRDFHCDWVQDVSVHFVLNYYEFNCWNVLNFCHFLKKKILEMEAFNYSLWFYLTWSAHEVHLNCCWQHYHNGFAEPQYLDGYYSWFVASYYLAIYWNITSVDSYQSIGFNSYTYSYLITDNYNYILWISVRKSITL